MWEYWMYFPFFILHDWAKDPPKPAAPIVRCCLFDQDMTRKGLALLYRLNRK